MRAIVAVICPLVCMMTMASARPDNGVNVTPASQTETGVNEVEKKSEGFFSYNAKGVYKAASQRTYKYELGVFRNRNVKGAVICYVGLSVKGNTLHSGYPFYWNSGERLFRFPLSARHKEVKVSACNFDAFHPETTGDVIAERLTAYVDYYPCDAGKTKVRFEVTQLHRSDLTEYKKWMRDAGYNKYRCVAEHYKHPVYYSKDRTDKEQTRAYKKWLKLDNKVEAMKNK